MAARSAGMVKGIALFAACALLSCTGEHGGSALERVRAKGVLTWGADVQGGEPYVFADPREPGTLIGFEVDIAEAIARRIGVRAEMVQNDWSSLVPSLERGTFDMAMNGLEVTPTRAGRVLFSRPYYVFAERLIARADDASITDLESLAGKRVGTLASSLAWEMLLASSATPVPYEGVEEPYIDLERGRTDAVLLDDIIAERYGQPRPALRVVKDVGDGHYAIGFRPADRELRDAVDRALGELAESGELSRILAKWRLDGPRQTKLRTWSEADQAAMVRAETHAVLGVHHLWLFLQGAAMTLLVSTGAMMIAIPFGMLLALMRLYARRPLAFIASAYVEVFRGTPVLLQLYLLYYGLAAFVRVDALTAAIVGLGLNYASYEAEVYRGGIQAVPKGQMEAARALGMSTWMALRRIVLPQAFRTSLPSVTNDFIALLKDSSLVSVITVVELTKRMTITAVDVRSWLLPGLLCAALYFAMSYPLSLLSRHLERKLARS